MYARRVLAITLVVLGWTALAQSKDLALISNKSNELVAITFPELAKICKGQVSRWPDGKPVSFITRDPTAPEMKLLLEKVYAMSKDEVKALSRARTMAGPTIRRWWWSDSDEDVVKKVESIPGAVGLVDVYSISGGVTVVKVGGKLPLEPGYLVARKLGGRLRDDLAVLQRGNRLPRKPVNGVRVLKGAASSRPS